MTTLMKLFVFTIAIVVTFSSFSLSTAADLGATWSASGTAELNGITIEVIKDGGGDFRTSTFDASGPNFSFAPLSDEENSLEFSRNSNLSISFSSPVERLRLYLSSWRDGTYQLNRSFDLKSGSNFTRSDNEITVSGGFAKGVIEFTEPVSSLTILSSAFSTSDFSRQRLHLGTSTPDSPDLQIPRLKINGGKIIRSKRKFVTVRGTAAGSVPIQTVEVRVENEKFLRADGTSNWSFRFQPKREKTRLTVRATDQSGVTSAESIVSVLMERPLLVGSSRPKSARQIIF